MNDINYDFPLKLNLPDGTRLSAQVHKEHYDPDEGYFPPWQTVVSGRTKEEAEKLKSSNNFDIIGLEYTAINGEIKQTRVSREGLIKTIGRDFFTAGWDNVHIFHSLDGMFTQIVEDLQ